MDHSMLTGGLYINFYEVTSSILWELVRDAIELFDW